MTEMGWQVTLVGHGLSMMPAVDTAYDLRPLGADAPSLRRGSARELEPEPPCRPTLLDLAAAPQKGVEGAITLRFVEGAVGDRGHANAKRPSWCCSHHRHVHPDGQERRSGCLGCRRRVAATGVRVIQVSVAHLKIMACHLTIKPYVMQNSEQCVTCGFTVDRLTALARCNPLRHRRAPRQNKRRPHTGATARAQRRRTCWTGRACRRWWSGRRRRSIGADGKVICA